jgi:hypothetical protein
MRSQIRCSLIQLLGLVIGLVGTANFLPIFTGTGLWEGIKSITLFVVAWALGGRMMLKPANFLKQARDQ